MATKASSKPKPKRSHHRKQPSSSPLPPPLEMAASPSLVPEPKPNGAGLLSGLGNLFASPNPEPPSPSPEQTFSTGPQSSPAGFSPELSPEAEQILAQIPETIGDGAAAAVPGELGGADDFDLAGEICDEEAARDILEWVGESLADWRKREEYRAAGQRAGGAAKHWSRVVNGLWTRYAPVMLASLGESMPGLIPAVAMTAIAFGPAIASDMRQTSEERRRRGLAQPQRSPQPISVGEPATAEPARPRRGIVFDS